MIANSNIAPAPDSPQTASHQKQIRRRRRRTRLKCQAAAAACATLKSTMFLKSIGFAFLLLTALALSRATADEAPPQPAALVSSPQKADSTTNVILIKYANVTSTSKQDDATTGDQQAQTDVAPEQQLNVFKLYEPLSVAIIESKFAHSIQLFDVSQNQLSTLSKDLFCPLSNEVRQLNISHNLLENFDCLGLISQAGQLCLSELRVLDMSYNLIKHLPATGVATLHNLEILNLSHNLIESLDELALSSLFKLTKLDLSFNRIQQLPVRIFHKSTSMQVLKLQSNFLQTSISQMFLSGLISLEELNLSHNNISQVNDSAFLDKVNLTRVDLSHNQLASLKQEALRVTSVRQAAGYRQRLHHNGQYAGVAPKQTNSQSASAEFFLASNPFICDCHLEWLRKFQPSAIKRTVLSSSSSSSSAAAVAAAAAASASTIHLANNPVDLTSDAMLADQARDQLSSQLMQLSSSNVYQNDQPSVILASASSDSSNNISEIISNQQAVESTQQQTASPGPSGSSRPLATLLSTSQQQQQAHVTHHYARIGDLDLIKCTPSFRRNTQRSHHNHDRTHHRVNGQLRPVAPPDGVHHSHHGHHPVSRQQQQDTMIDLMTADSSNFLCPYNSHCFALCHCCEFDACDCEMICPAGCNCYYDSTWQTNIIDCSSNNHTVVPGRIPMDVSGLYLDGNNIESLKPSNLIARKSLKTLYLNSSNLQYIANRTFNGLIELQTLYLHDNMLRSLNGHEFEPLAQLRALYLQSNRLDHISNQTFIYLRSLEILDLSNNRLTSTNLDLFWSVGHHNIRLRQLSIAHNWWSCQCSSINRFRQILKQKFLLNGSVNIADKNQLRCYHNSTTVGPLILAEVGNSMSQQPLFASYPAISGGGGNRQQQQSQQQQLTEINQCSDIIEDRGKEIDFNPPLIQAVTELPPNVPPSEYPNDPYYPQEPPMQPNQANGQFGGQPPMLDQPIYTQPGLIVQPDQTSMNNNLYNGGAGIKMDSNSMPLTSFILMSILFVGIMAIAVSIFVFVRQQQRTFHKNHNHHHHHHHHNKKSSAASTTSASSSASSTAISSLNGKSHQQRHSHLHPSHHTLHTAHNHQHHLIMSNNSNGGATTANINHLHHHQSHHHHSASSQSNIYAALVPPPSANAAPANPTNVGLISGHNSNANNNNLYSNSSTTASHHSSSSHNVHSGFHGASQWPPTANQLNQSVYHYGGLNAIDNPYAVNVSSQASYKTTGSLYNATNNNNCHDTNLALGATNPNDWIKLPKVKQFMSKLVNKSLALGGYRSCSRDELSGITSDKIYDAFISYDKQDEAFVLQHISAELEYGHPQYRIAMQRDLPLPTSAYIAEAITSVIGCSHRTIVVLTENYLQSSLCRYELQAALREASADKSHKIIAIVLDPKCLQEMDADMRALLTAASSSTTIYQSAGQQQQQQQQHSAQLVQLDGSANNGTTLADQMMQQQQLIATLTSQAGGNQQICTQTAHSSRINFVTYSGNKFWPKIKQLMPSPRASTQTLTLTTKN